jgi:predicted DsbA family dithiol-disulfide isomerase
VGLSQAILYTEGMKKKILIEAVVDIVCPWCFIGKQYLKQVQEQGKDKYDIEVRYLPYQLDPTTPMEGIERDLYLINKFGNMMLYNEAENRVREAAHRAGIEIHLEKIKVQINSFDCHRLIWWAGQFGKNPEMTLALYNAYYLDGVDLSKKTNLVEAAVSVGLDGEAAKKILDGKEGTMEVASLLEEAYKMGVTGVPFFIFNRTVAFSGAQPPEVFFQILERV